ncbi:uncharacterized protein Z520_06823 [Fonsecaea multimorphosa CBS 102226]|uniref:Chromatin modification-related protein n=1 Tax=Fonsecaea multimorphosa CBS 102226 TaxID=1442371 RepID=A0A0D2IJY4_9EURO|nr:uncharacterized protein Z520_06823 [Fonsecaea multimorphosa CBS 102226]KIX97371.1 hypothetical protein Z520_06823 [Fonsecaea multimorphosa CBS 102226]OAL23338.1 hypothetical protein AYO22_06388 [Fonsecaea multimorphosa]
MTTTLGTSNVRGGPSRLTRINPARASKGLGSTLLRQNSLVSNSGLALASSSAAVASQSQTNNDPPGMYPAITHFADAIAALPREYRRHTSLLKEVDAKAWGPEENLRDILEQCLADSATTTRDLAAASQSLTGSTTADDALNVSEANSVAGASFDNASLISVRSADPIIMQRRQQYHALRQNLMTIMVTMDEKNHVINNANEEVGRHIRRLDRIWPHIAEEISEEARLGSLKHWAYTETNPVKKPTAPTTRREAAAAGLATLHESEIAHRSEARREAVLARRQRGTAQHADSDFDDPKAPARKTTTSGKKRAADAALDPTGLGITGAGTGKRKRPEKPATAGVAMERSISSALGGRPMSRENSQQENSKKRKASAAATSVARKRYVPEKKPENAANLLSFRINAATQDSPKLASSPLAGTTGKEAYKRSPALSAVRPATARGRQNSAHTVESVRGRPSSLTSSRNGNSNNVVAGTSELSSSAAVSGKSTTEVKSNLKEAKADKGDRPVEDEPASQNDADGEQPAKGTASSDKSSSRQDTARGDLHDEISAKEAASPRLPLVLQTSELKNERLGRGRASKTSTPVVGTFAEAEAAETSSTGGNGGAANKSKRPARPRVKDHGLHDSLSPKGLPMKRPHKKSASLSFPATTTLTGSQQRVKDETDPHTTESLTPSERDLATGSIVNNEADTHAGDVDVDEDEETGDGVEEDEERYCYCQGVSYGEMVACDRDDCPRQWFHLECIGLKSVPKSAKWYCEECKEVLARSERTGGGKGKNGGGNGHGHGHNGK